jgi:hypothetical protein
MVWWQLREGLLGPLFNLRPIRSLLACAFGALVATTPQISGALDNDFQSWTILTASGPLAENGKLRWYFEAQPRIGDDSTDIERLLVRPAIWYKFDNGWSIWAGYGWTPTFLDSQYNDKYRSESRIWTQLMNEHKLGAFDLVHRMRLEQRFIQGFPGVDNRFRYLLRASRELATIDSVGPVGATGYNELFVNLDDAIPGPEPGFDRDRVFLGPYVKYGPMRAELGYLGEYGRRRGDEGRLINAVALALNFTF